MKNRQPYDLKYLIQGYNLSQVFISAYICYELMFNGWFTHYNWGCQAVEKDDSDSTRRMVRTLKHYFNLCWVEPKNTEPRTFRTSQNWTSNLPNLQFPPEN